MATPTLTRHRHTTTVCICLTQLARPSGRQTPSFRRLTNRKRTVWEVAIQLTVSRTATTHAEIGAVIAADTTSVVLILSAADMTVAAGIGHQGVIPKAAGASFPVGAVTEDAAA